VPRFEFPSLYHYFPARLIDRRSGKAGLDGGIPTANLIFTSQADFLKSIMVCDASMVAGTIVSVMMNGLCCAFQQQEEEERREALRRDIRAEYHRQRLIDVALWEKRALAGLKESSSLSLEDEDCLALEHDRRRKLLLTKMDAAQRIRNEPVTEKSESRVDNGRIPPPSSISKTRTHSSPNSTMIIGEEEFNTQFKALRLLQKASLLDEDNEEEETSLVEVPLQY
jgi:hypothetical protein